MNMTPGQFWQNFELGKEVEIACGFLYDGLRNLENMRSFRWETEIFPVLYNLSVGVERLMKVAVVLLEFHDGLDPESFEKTLITHNHADLMARIRRHTELSMAGPHNEFLDLLAKFYKSFRYDRFSLTTTRNLSKEKKALLSYLEKHLSIDVTEHAPFSCPVNDARTKRFIGKILRGIVLPVYQVIHDKGREKGLYTHEVRYDFKAGKLLLGEEFDFSTERTVWKEVLIFLMNTKETTGLLEFLRGIPPLDLDPADIPSFLDVLAGHVEADVSSQVQELHLDVSDKKNRFQMLELLDEAHAMQWNGEGEESEAGWDEAE